MAGCWVRDERVERWAWHHERLGLRSVLSSQYEWEIEVFGDSDDIGGSSYSRWMQV